MNATVYISFAVAPVLILIGIILLNSSRFNNWKSIGNLLIFGLLSVVFVVAAKYLIDLRWHGNYHGLKRTLFYIVIGLALTSEVFKYIALRIALPKLAAIKKPVDGVVFGIFLGLGFVTAADILIAYKIIGLTPAFYEKFKEYYYIFLFSYPFANIVFGITMGYFVSMGRLKKIAFFDDLTAIFAAAFFHSLFYFSFFTHDNVLISITSLGFILIAAILISQAIKISRRMD
ncbi:MAG TPA: PrsW family intramembrane metalloprotease [Bacteroidetes bacterium]|nr:PrsW family intramembrane metalloprotease [Bacteroidota bacterium]